MNSTGSGATSRAHVFMNWVMCTRLGLRHEMHTRGYSAASSLFSPATLFSKYVGMNSRLRTASTS